MKILIIFLLIQLISRLEAQILPISSWIYRDSTYVLNTTLAEQKDWFSGEKITGITVYMTTADISCGNNTVYDMGQGAWVSIKFLNFEIGDYTTGAISIMMSYWDWESYNYSNIQYNFMVTGGLTFIDTVTEKRISGWVNFEDVVFEENELCKISGSFDVPYCSLNQASTISTNTKATLNEYTLYDNYPDPFNPSTTIKFDLLKPGNVKIEVYNNLGQKIETLINKYMSAGSHQVEFKAQNQASGLYFYSLEAADFYTIKKMILLK